MLRDTDGFLHRHTQMEYNNNLDSEHVIVDKFEWLMARDNESDWRALCHRQADELERISAENEKLKRIYSIQIIEDKDNPLKLLKIANKRIIELEKDLRASHENFYKG